MPTCRNPFTAQLFLRFCIGAVAVCVVGSSSSLVLAGCGRGHFSKDGSFEVEARAGELPLRLYVQYVNGTISFTFTPPAEPCDGPDCKAKPKMRPFGMLPWTVRFVSSTSLRDDTIPCWSFSSPTGRRTNPTSTYAPRGGLQPLEHPPKIVSV